MAEEIPKIAYVAIVTIFIIVVGSYVVSQVYKATHGGETETPIITTVIKETQTVTQPVTTTVTETRTQLFTVTSTVTRTKTEARVSTVTVTKTATETVMKSYWAFVEDNGTADLSVTGGLIPSTLSFNTITNYGFAEIEWRANGTVQFSFAFQTMDNRTFSFTLEPAANGTAAFPLMPTKPYGFATYITNLENHPVHVEYKLKIHYIYPNPEQ